MGLYKVLRPKPTEALIPSAGSDGRRPAQDSRLDAFRLWLDAHDRNDVAAAQRATRKLREFHISVCPLSPDSRPGGGR
jgi:hypothetical protein